MIDLILAALSVWRLTYMLVNEKGPGHVFEKLRQRLIVRTSTQFGTMSLQHVEYRNVLGEILDCHYCCSVWVSAPFALYLVWRLSDPFAIPTLWLGLSAAAILIELGRRKLDP